MCCKRELYCPPSHDRTTHQRAHRCPPGPVTRPASSPHALRRPRLRRSTPPRPCARQPAAKPAQSQPRSGGEKPLLYHLRSVPARLCGIRGGRAAPHMHPQAPRGVAAAARAKRNTHQPKRPCPASAMLSYGRRCSAATNLQLGGGPSKQAPAPDQPRQLGPGARARCRRGPVPGAGRMPRDPPGAVRPR